MTPLPAARPQGRRGAGSSLSEGGLSPPPPLSFHSRKVYVCVIKCWALRAADGDGTCTSLPAEGVAAWL